MAVDRRLGTKRLVVQIELSRARHQKAGDRACFQIGAGDEAQGRLRDRHLALLPQQPSLKPAAAGSAPA